MPDCRIICADAAEGLKKLPDESVHCMITSPPYWGLRDYGTAEWEGGDPQCQHSVGGQVEDSKAPGAITGGVRPGVDASVCRKCGARRLDLQIGLEMTPDEYVTRLVAVFREAKRVLRKDGTLWVVVGDSYAGSWGNSGNRPELDGQTQGQRDKNCDYIHRGGWDGRRERPPSSYKQPGLKPKDLCMVPERLALALQADGWWVRARVPWVKQNGMPDSTEDRPSSPSSVEYVWMLSKTPDYFYDHTAVKVRAVCDRIRGPQVGGHKPNGGDQSGLSKRPAGPTRARRMNDWFLETFRGMFQLPEQDAPLACIVNPRACGHQHYATYPVELIAPIIMAATSQRGCCPACGAPWERVVSKEERLTAGRRELRDSGRVGEKRGTRSGTPDGSNTRGYRQYDDDILGWRPGCKCFGLPLIEQPPCEPVQKHDESDADFTARQQAWTTARADWDARWATLCPKYEDLPVEPCTVLDMFHGLGTTGVAAKIHERHYIGIELSLKYIEWSKQRIASAKADGTSARYKEDALPLFEDGEAGDTEENADARQ